jgi:F-type H+-transporting ATPase subunit gamma
MTLTLKQIKRRIRSIENTEKLTKAMELISISKLRPLRERLIFASEYFLKTQGTVERLLASFSNLSHPFLKERENKQKITLCVFTSDTGLCSSYNSDIIQAAEKFILEQKAYEVNLVCVGKKGFIHFKKKGFKISDVYTDFQGRYSLALSDKIVYRLIDLFSSGQADEVHVAYTYFVSAARRRPTVQKILNIVPAADKEIQYLVEPDIETLGNNFLPSYVRSQVRFMMLHALVAEHSARGMAMKEAADNAEEMLEGLVLLRNKVRQANITREIIEVISSADALKG